MANKTLIIAILNKAYMEQIGMLQLFLQSFREGEGARFLIRHLLFVAVDQTSFNQCCTLGLDCYRFATNGIEMMWRRTLFLGDVLKRGYSFIFTDVDVIWSRNPFTKLNQEGEDLQMSSDFYNGRPFDDSNFFNTGFYFVTPNNKTTALFDEWNASKHNFTRMNDQVALLRMKRAGVFRWLGLKVRYLDTTCFTGFCQKSNDFGQVITVHSNCCVSVKAKFTNLAAVLEAWTSNNGTSNATWPMLAGFCL